MRRKVIPIVVILSLFATYLWANADPARYYAFSTSKQPTLQELKAFIYQDQTNNNTYTPSYQCRHFSFDVIGKAKKFNYRCGYVSLDGHAIVAFDTTSGIYFLEPQMDILLSQQQLDEMISNRFYNVSICVNYCDVTIQHKASFYIVWWL